MIIFNIAVTFFCVCIAGCADRNSSSYSEISPKKERGRNYYSGYYSPSATDEDTDHSEIETSTDESLRRRRRRRRRRSHRVRKASFTSSEDETTDENSRTHALRTIRRSRGAEDVPPVVLIETRDLDEWKPGRPSSPSAFDQVASSGSDSTGGVGMSQSVIPGPPLPPPPPPLLPGSCNVQQTPVPTNSAVVASPEDMSGSKEPDTTPPAIPASGAALPTEVSRSEFLQSIRDGAQKLRPVRKSLP